MRKGKPKKEAHANPPTPVDVKILLVLQYSSLLWQLLIYLCSLQEKLVAQTWKVLFANFQFLQKVSYTHTHTHIFIFTVRFNWKNFIFISSQNVAPYSRNKWTYLLLMWLIMYTFTSQLCTVFLKCMSMKHSYNILYTCPLLEVFITR